MQDSQFFKNSQLSQYESKDGHQIIHNKSGAMLILLKQKQDVGTETHRNFETIKTENSAKSHN